MSSDGDIRCLQALCDILEIVELFISKEDLAYLQSDPDSSGFYIVQFK
jgi:hypothetical protein